MDWLDPSEGYLFAVFGDSCSEGVLAVVLSCAHNCKKSRTRHLVALNNNLDLDNFWRTMCDGSSLIKHH